MYTTVVKTDDLYIGNSEPHFTKKQNNGVFFKDRLQR